MMMFVITRCLLYFQRRLHKPSATNAIYIITFCYLILFSIFNTLYNDTILPQKVAQLDTYDLKDVTVNRVECSFPVSSQYEITPRCICYLLLVFTVAIRNQGWLAAGAAASVLTYSGVAAIHSLVLFATNNKFHQQEAKTHCESIPTPGFHTRFIACAGIGDPDVSKIVQILTSVMLGALPMAAWSTTFKKSASKAILMFWLLLLAVGHTFYPLTAPDVNFHFQICPKGYVELLPKTKYQAPVLDDAWSESFHSLILASQQASSFLENGSVPTCLYSCFATTAYNGRSGQEITVSTPENSNPFLKSSSKERLSIIIFWWAYAFLALLTLFTIEKKGRLPKWVFKRVCSVEYRQHSWMSIWKYKGKSKHATNIVKKGQGSGNHTTTASFLAAPKPPPMKHFQITILQLIQLVTQLSSVAACGGGILYIEITNKAQHKLLLEQEEFAAVGQWSCVTVVILVLFAAVVGRVWAADERHGGVESVAFEEIWSAERGDERCDEEWMGMEDWDWRVGYAS